MGNATRFYPESVRGVTH